jgi:hypothetical protein
MNTLPNIDTSEQDTEPLTNLQMVFSTSDKCKTFALLYE